MKHKLILYVCGSNDRSRSALQNLTTAFAAVDDFDYSLRVIDVAEDPDAADRRGLVATPTLIRHEPLPEVRVVGDLDDSDALIDTLGLRVDG